MQSFTLAVINTIDQILEQDDDLTLDDVFDLVTFKDWLEKIVLSAKVRGSLQTLFPTPVTTLKIPVVSLYANIFNFSFAKD